MYGANDIRIEDIEKPEYDAEGLLLKVEVIGLCGSDIRNLTTDSRKGDYPHIYGHEVVGTVAEVGRNVPNLPLATDCTSIQQFLA